MPVEIVHSEDDEDHATYCSSTRHDSSLQSVAENTDLMLCLDSDTVCNADTGDGASCNKDSDDTSLTPVANVASDCDIHLTFPNDDDSRR